MARETQAGTGGAQRNNLLCAAGLAAWVVLVYLLTSRGVPETMLGWLGIERGHSVLWQVSHALFWGSLFVAARYVSHRIPAQPRPSRLLISIAVLAGLFQVALFALAGLALGVGASPYSHALVPLAANLMYLSAMLVAIEQTRACLVAIISVRSATLALVISAALLSLVSISLARLSSAGDAESLFALAGGDVLPALSEGLLASLLVFVGGPLASIAYRGVLIGAEWLSPILPSLDWPVAAFVGTVGPVFGLWMIHNAAIGEEEVSSPGNDGRWFLELAGVVDSAPSPIETDAELKELEPPPASVASESAAATEGHRGHRGWLSVGVISVTVVWFVTGMFGVQPVAVSGSSMNPTLEVGDIVILRDVPPDEVDVGDIIQFQLRGIPVIHRVVEINDGGPQTVFITRGDNNNVDDGPVLAGNVNGKAVLVVPKAGWPGVWLRNLIGGLT